MHMLIELNRVLKWAIADRHDAEHFQRLQHRQSALGNSPYVYGEYNPKAGDRHSREYATSEIKLALNAAGFKPSSSTPKRFMGADR